MSQSKKSGDGLEKLADGLIRFTFIFLKICYHGLKKLPLKSFDTWAILFIIMSFLGVSILGDTNYLYEVIKLVSLGTPPLLLELFFKIPPVTQYGLFLFLILSGILIAYGLKEFNTFIKYQQALNRTGLRSALGEIPKVEAIVPTGEHRSKVVVETYGVGLNKFEACKDSLTASFRQTVERITLNEDKGKLNIYLCERDLPMMVGFHDLFESIKEPYSFIIGQSLQGPMVQAIRSLPHLLVSGATGGGKSVFFRSTMLSLLKSSPHIQLYLLDLKRGVEVKEFAELPNVQTAKDEKEATNLLASLVAEMNRRYKILEEKGKKSIDPERDKLDLIVVGIDEAAALFGNKSNESARKHIGELARLARASGIHLIPSTQKPVKEAINTETLDNLPGRMTFRMISSAASNVAMGGNFAKKLPPIKGRAMWTNGSEHVQVQAPYISDKDMEDELKIICEEFKTGERKNFQELLGGKQNNCDIDDMTEEKGEKEKKDQA